MKTYWSVIKSTTNVFLYEVQRKESGYVVFENHPSESEQIILYLLEHVVLIKHRIEYRFMAYGILGIAYKLGIYEQIKTLLIMYGLGDICTDCDLFLATL